MQNSLPVSSLRVYSLLLSQQMDTTQRVCWQWMFQIATKDVFVPSKVFLPLAEQQGGKAKRCGKNSIACDSSGYCGTFCCFTSGNVSFCVSSPVDKGEAHCFSLLVPRLRETKQLSWQWSGVFQKIFVGLFAWVGRCQNSNSGAYTWRTWFCQRSLGVHKCSLMTCLSSDPKDDKNLSVLLHVRACQKKTTAHWVPSECPNMKISGFFWVFFYNKADSVVFLLSSVQERVYDCNDTGMLFLFNGRLAPWCLINPWPLTWHPLIAKSRVKPNLPPAGHSNTVPPSSMFIHALDLFKAFIASTGVPCTRAPLLGRDQFATNSSQISSFKRCTQLNLSNPKTGKANWKENSLQELSAGWLRCGCSFCSLCN